MANNCSDDVRQHLSFVQDVISRMNSNAFSMKGWMVAIVSALCAIYASKALDACSYIYFLVAIPVTIIFWLLDAYYLKMELQYRDLYNHILEDKENTNFNMDSSRFKQCFFKAMVCSWSTAPLYISVIALLVLAIVLVTI